MSSSISDFKIESTAANKPNTSLSITSATLNKIQGDEKSIRSEHATWNENDLKQLGEKISANNNLMNLIFTRCTLNIAALAQTIKAKPSIMALSLIECIKPTDDITPLLELLKSRLRLINLCDNNFTADTTNLILQTVAANRDLMHLFLSGNQINNNTAGLIAGLIKQTTALKRLYLAKMEGASIKPEAGGRDILQAMKHNLTLLGCEFSLSSTRNTFSLDNSSSSYLGYPFDQEIEDLIFRNKEIGDFKSGNSSLLNLNNLSLTHETILPVVKIIENSKFLHSLDLSHNPLSDKGIKVLLDALKKSSSLVELNLLNTGITNSGADDLATVLASKTPLALLQISNDPSCGNKNTVTRAGFSAIALTLKNNTTLTTLDASYNPIPGDALGMLGECLTSNKTLTSLNLSNTQIDENAAISFMQKIDPSQNKELKSKRAKSDAPRNTSITTLSISQAIGSETANKWPKTVAKMCYTYLSKNRKEADSLITAVEFGSLVDLKKHLLTASPYKITSDRDTLLHLAVKKGSVEITKYLLNLGFNTRLLNKDGKTALKLAKEAKNEELVQLFPQSDSKPAADSGQQASSEYKKRKAEESVKDGKDSQESQQDNSLWKKPKIEKSSAAASQSSSVSSHNPSTSSGLKLDRAVPMDTSDSLKSSSAGASQSSSMSSKNPPTTFSLKLDPTVNMDTSDELEPSSEDNKPSETQLNQLFSLVASGQSWQLQFFLTQHKNLVNITYRETTCLHIAAQFGQLECAQLLLNAGADINKLDQQGYTPLYALISSLNMNSGNPQLNKQKCELAYLLVDHGADTNLKMTDKDFSREEFTALHKTVACGNYRLMKIVLNSPTCNPNMRDKQGWSALDWAVKRCDLEALDRLLIDRRWDKKSIETTLKRLKDASGNNALHDKIIQAQALLEKRLNTTVLPSESLGIQWVKSFSVLFGSRYGRPNKSVLVEQDEEHAYLCLQNEFSANRLYKLTEDEKDVSGNPVTASMTFIVSANPYKPGDNPVRTQVKIRLAFTGSHHVNSAEKDEKKAVKDILHRASSAPKNIFDEKHQSHNTSPLQPKAILESYQAWIKDQDPSFAQNFHHGEQGLLSYMELPETADIIIQTLMGHKNFAKGCKIYAVILDIHSPRYPCENCEVAILGEQNSKESPFLKTLANKLKGFGYVIPTFSPLRMITQVSSYQPFNHEPVKNKDHASLQIDMRNCGSNIILTCDLSAAQPTLTQYHSTAASC